MKHLHSLLPLCHFSIIQHSLIVVGVFSVNIHLASHSANMAKNLGVHLDSVAKSKTKDCCTTQPTDGEFM